jgi:hypothetical protein
MVNFDQFLALFHRILKEAQIVHSIDELAWSDAADSLWACLPQQQPISMKIGVNVTTKHRTRKANVNHRRSAVPGRAWGTRKSPEMAVEAIPAEPYCCDRELSAAPVWNCHVYNGSL